VLCRSARRIVRSVLNHMRVGRLEIIESGDRRGALEAFEAVLVIHPHAIGARARVEMLRRQLDLRRI